MAALHWIQQNIEKFGGNPTMITLVGHGTGAACIDFLMSSPTMGKGKGKFAVISFLLNFISFNSTWIIPSSHLDVRLSIFFVGTC